MTGEASPYIGRILDVALASAQAIVVLLTPDEITYLRSEYGLGADDADTKPAAQARPNVLFEAGMAIGRDPDRTVLVEFGHVRPFSDVAGRHVLRLDNSPERRKDLAQRLATAGCEVDFTGTDWLTAGDLTPPPPPGGGLPLGKRVPERSAAIGARLDARYHDRGNSNGRLEIINRGNEPIFKLNVELPSEAGVQLLTDELPLAKLPAGKSAMLMAVHLYAHGSSDHFEIRITGETADGQPVAEDVFISLVG
jgi:hypothetical protein